ncbi:hypothetical protein HDU97_009776 [Phlyctochytrium planicorne]|nr:hypothetical protein HDU97_009776 [Phlyctochytrium planicorne]
MPCHHRCLLDSFSTSEAIRSSDGGSTFCSEAAIPSYAPNFVLEPTYLALTISFDFQNESIAGHVRHTIKNPRTNVATAGSVLAKELSKITLNAVSMDIHAVTDVGGNALDYDYDGKEIRIQWKDAFKPSESRIVEIKYKVEKPIAGLYFHVPDAVVKDTATHCITDHETERARYWLPCVDFPAVRTTLEFHLIAPKNFIALANGAETGIKDNGDGTKTTSYYLSHPCPSYILCLAVGDFVEAVDEPVDDMPIKYYAPSNFSAKDLMTTFGKTPAMVRWLQKKVGYKFPWPKYYQIVSPEVFGGAMENISLVTYTDRLLIDEIAAKDFADEVDSTNIHEMAHTYFGDLLVIRHFEHAWLKESWATYVSALWLEDHTSHEEYRYQVILDVKDYIEECEDYMRPIVTRTYDSSDQLFDRHIYPGGAVRIHMLRHILGDEVFWAAVKNYVSTHANRVVETEDFKRCLEQESGLNLTRFFDQWIYSPGFPKITATYEYNADKKQVQIILEQTQASKKDGIPVFEIAVEVDVIDADGKAFTVTIPFEDSKSRAFGFIQLVEAKPSIVEIDPRGKIILLLDFNPGEAILEATAKGGRDISSRIHAYNQLIKSGTVSAFKKVKEYLPHEPFFGVRSSVYTALAASKTQAAIDILASSLSFETEPRALRILLSKCSIKDDSIRRGLLYILQDVSKLTYNARTQAYMNLGKQRHPDDVQVLIKAASDPVLGTAGNVRAGVLRGLGYHRSREAYEYLLSRLPRRSECMRAQMAVILALGDIGLWLPYIDQKAISELIAEQLRDPHHQIRRSALVALQTLGASEHAGAAKSSLSSFPEQDKCYLVKRIKSIGEGNPKADKIKTLTSTLEDLEARIKKLEQQYQLAEAKEMDEEKRGKA